MKRRIRIGSRASKLAVIQAEIVKDLIERNYPECLVEIIMMTTTGDRIQDRSLDQIGGKGLFVKELDQALLEDRIDLSVHSLKDMPMEVPKDLPILAFTKREDPRDVLIYKPGRTNIPKSGIIGTSSKRRAMQVQRLYPGCKVEGIRGNVQTRLRKLEQEPYDGMILAAAGLHRLGLESYIGKLFSVQEMVPAAGQGILAVQGRAGESHPYLECVNDTDSMYAALAERAFVTLLEGGCSAPTAAYARVQGREIKLTGLYDCDGEFGAGYEVASVTGTVEQAEKLGEWLARKMKSS